MAICISRSSLVVNHQVLLPGSHGRAAAGTHRIRYIATRLGAVRGLTPADEAFATRQRKLRLAGYLDRRPGAAAALGTALFDQLGPVALADARRELAQAKGAGKRKADQC